MLMKYTRYNIENYCNTDIAKNLEKTQKRPWYIQNNIQPAQRIKQTLSANEATCRNHLSNGIAWERKFYKYI